MWFYTIHFAWLQYNLATAVVRNIYLPLSDTFTECWRRMPTLPFLHGPLTPATSSSLAQPSTRLCHYSPSSARINLHPIPTTNTWSLPAFRWLFFYCERSEHHSLRAEAKTEAAKLARTNKAKFYLHSARRKNSVVISLLPLLILAQSLPKCIY